MSFQIGDKVTYLGGDAEVFFAEAGDTGTVTEDYPMPSSEPIVGVTFDTRDDLMGNPLLQYVDENFLVLNEG